MWAVDEGHKAAGANEGDAQETPKKILQGFFRDSLGIL